MFGNEGGLGDFLRSRIDRFRAHPVQGLLGGLAGMAGGPLAGQLASRGFNWFNNHEFNNSVGQANQNLGDQTDQTNRDIWGKPLNGPLGQFDGSGQGSNNGALAQAMGGGGYNGATQSPFSGNYGNNYGQGMPSSTPWTQEGNPGGLLDFLGPAPPSSGPMNHQELMDKLQNPQNGSGMGPPALYGVSNFMVGGAPVINGVRPAGYDPNQGALAHHWPGN